MAHLWKTYRSGSYSRLLPVTLQAQIQKKGSQRVKSHGIASFMRRPRSKLEGKKVNHRPLQANMAPLARESMAQGAC